MKNKIALILVLLTLSIALISLLVFWHPQQEASARKSNPAPQRQVVTSSATPLEPKKVLPPPKTANETYRDLNTFWNRRDYKGIKEIIDDLLLANENDVAAIGLEQMYYTFCVRDMNQAHSAALKLKSLAIALKTKSKQDVALYLSDMILKIPTEEPLPNEVVEFMHKNANRYPFIDNIFIMASKTPPITN